MTRIAVAVPCSSYFVQVGQRLTLQNRPGDVHGLWNQRSVANAMQKDCHSITQQKDCHIYLKKLFSGKFEQ